MDGYWNMYNTGGHRPQDISAAERGDQEHANIAFPEEGDPEANHLFDIWGCSRNNNFLDLAEELIVLFYHAHSIISGRNHAVNALL